MNIVVLVKQVPDSGAERTLSASDNTVERSSASNVINEMDEYAIEEALKIKEAHGGEVTVLTVGPAGLNAQHTPEYCYPGSGYQLVGQPQNLTPSGRTDVLRTAVYRKQLGGATESIRILWAWTTSGAWTAPRYPELAFFGRAPLFKLYVVTDAVDGDPNEDQLLQSFVAELMNNLCVGS